ncbi:hypothetical protein GCM10022408_12020 [Hymenobacter fastidiosus]|uniref:Uncharacterized protein n=1 Tax=Hymenobacter fastidiosus TaxID=486264 RepID=A0ABP7RU02_9BACT
MLGTNPKPEPAALVSNDVSVDAMVYHPRTTYRGGRPDWVFSPGRRPVAVARPASVGYPCLILAYAAAEDLTRAVPVDVVELQSPQDQKALALPRGNYTVVAKDHTGNTRTWTVKN